MIGKTGTGWLTADATTAFMGTSASRCSCSPRACTCRSGSPGSSAGSARGAVAAVVTGVLAVPAGLLIARSLVGGPRRRLRAAGRERLSGDRAADPRGGAATRTTRALTLMAQVGIADVAAIVALPLVMQPHEAGARGARRARSRSCGGCGLLPRAGWRYAARDPSFAPRVEAAHLGARPAARARRAVRAGLARAARARAS